MPNTENIDKLITAIKAKPTHFKMDTWKKDGDLLHACGTAACLGGWANTLSGHLAVNAQGDARSNGNDEAAREWLGIDYYQGNSLFYMAGKDQRMAFDNADANARAIAAERVLKVLRDEDRVDWDQALDAADLGDLIEPEDNYCDCDDCRHSD